jgi:hypothetical protein
MTNQIKIFLIIFITSSISCSAQEETEWQIKKEMIMISSGQFSPSEKIIFDNCEFDLVVNQQMDTIYLQTTDSSFITPEGYNVGTKWKSISNVYQSKLGRMPGWGYYITLDSGWQLGFCEGQTCTDSEPTDESVVTWIFRRNK